MKRMKDVLVALTDDHVVLSWLAHRLELSNDSAANAVLFNELAKALGGHLSALEYVVLPALSRCRWRGLDSQLLVGHMTLKRHLADLLTLERDSDQFRAQLTDFCRQVEAHADQEQLVLLPAIRECLDEGERAMLASEVESRLGAYLDEVARKGPALAAAPLPTADDLLREAQVVLTTLPASRCN